MKNKFGVYALLISLLTSTVTTPSSDEQILKNAKAKKMEALRQYPNLVGKSEDEVKNDMRHFREKYSRGASYFNNLKFENASRDAQAINNKAINTPCNTTR